MPPHNPLAVHDTFSAMAYALENDCWSWNRETYAKALTRRDLEIALGLAPVKSAVEDETPAATEPVDGHAEMLPMVSNGDWAESEAEDAWRAEMTRADDDDDADTEEPVVAEVEDEADLRDDDDGTVH